MEPLENKRIDELFRTPVCWLDAADADPVAISSRIRFARNLKGSYFSARADDRMLSEIRDLALAAVRRTVAELGFDVWEFHVDALSALDRAFLLERHLISREFLDPRHGAALATNRDHGTFVMINEEDHLRIQVLAPGFRLDELLRRIGALDDALSTRLEFAFDPALGYLTSCPTNTGTGMRASVMLHLPALSVTDQMTSVSRGVSKLGLTIRGFYGEGSKALGNLYQISNQSTLGESEEMIVARLSSVIGQIAAHEKRTRRFLLAGKRDTLLDFVGRAYGLLLYSRVISGEEALNALSAVRLGIDMGMFRSIDIETVNRLFLLLQAAHLQKLEGRGLDGAERGAVRASLLRNTLRKNV